MGRNSASCETRLQQLNPFRLFNKQYEKNKTHPLNVTGLYLKAGLTRSLSKITISLSGLIIVGCLVRLFNGDRNEKMARTGAEKPSLSPSSCHLSRDTWGTEDCKCVVLVNQREAGYQSFHWRLSDAKPGFHDTGAPSTSDIRQDKMHIYTHYHTLIFDSRCNSVFHAFAGCVNAHTNMWKGP